MLSMKCPNCGGTVQFDEKHIATFCSFCGSHLPDMSDYVRKTLDLDIKQKYHEMDMQTADKEIRKEKVKTVTSSIGNVFHIIKLVLFVIALLAVFSPLLLLVIK